ncbi:hypothetical protein AVEN_53848-1 [Araneus ventricosus]|uniref:Uncharacterized protein n=1 Tax=Araneus ventricosus TaxID=182803 RepID=A0A4Y2KEH0_ARAVE|nr:hypothetical protein AVEN_53848-1 [Araneus ventricosus]
MESPLSSWKFQEGDTLCCEINCQKRKELLYSPKIYQRARNLSNPASADQGGLRSDRAHKSVRAVLRSQSDHSLPLDVPAFTDISPERSKSPQNLRATTILDVPMAEDKMPPQTRTPYRQPWEQRSRNPRIKGTTDLF